MKGTNIVRMATLLIMAAWLAASVAEADIAVIVSAANLQDQNGALAPTGSIALLVMDKAGDGFATALRPSSPLNPGSILTGYDKPTNDVIIGKWDLSSLNITGQLLGITSVRLSSCSSPCSVALYWFPLLTSASTNVGLTVFGFYTDPVGIDGSDQWYMFGDGSLSQLNFYTASRGGSNSNSAGLARFGIPAERFRITGLTLNETNAVIGFDTISNYVYVVQSSTDLISSSWSTIASNFVGTGSILMNIDVGGAVSSQRFYRVGLPF